MTTLWLKELREHGFSLLLISATALGLGSVFVFGHAVDETAVAPYDAVLVAVVTLPHLVAWWLVERLITSEVANQTTTFLDALPIRRGVWVLEKYCFGLAATLAIAIGLVLIPLYLLAPGAGAVSAFAFWADVIRAAVHSISVYSFWFALAWLGRFRIAVGIGLTVVVFVLDAITGLELGRDGPWHLVDGTFAGRLDVPLVAWIQNIVPAAFFTGLGFSLALLGDGRTPSLLTGRLSQREWQFVLAIGVSALLLVYAFDEPPTPQPYTMDGGRTLTRDRVSVTVSSSFLATSEDETQLASRMDGLDAKLRPLQWPAMPPGFVFEVSWLDSGRVESYDSDNRWDGVFVRSRLETVSDHWDRVEEALLRGWVGHATGRRARAEPFRFVTDGFGWHFARWAHRREPLALDPDLVRCAKLAADAIEDDVFARWMALRDRVGREAARALSWSFLRTVHARVEDAAFLDFIRPYVARNYPDDVRGVLGSPHRVQHFESTTGLSFERTYQDWKSNLRNTPGWRPPKATATVEGPKGGPFQLRVQLQERPSWADARADVFVQSMAAWDHTLTEAPSDRERVSVDLLLEQGLMLSRTLMPGERLAWTVRLPVPDAPCGAISGWIRTSVGADE